MSRDNSNKKMTLVIMGEYEEQKEDIRNWQKLTTLCSLTLHPLQDKIGDEETSSFPPF